MSNYSAYLNARVAPGTLRQLDEIAAQRCTTRGSVVRQLLRDGLRDLEAMHTRWSREVAGLPRDPK
jgi:metal-responsive CopG/Arc/MetJ family transcriptional regulator